MLEIDDPKENTDPNEHIIKQEEETLEAQISRAGPQLSQLGELVGAMQRVVIQHRIPSNIVLFGIQTFLTAMVYAGCVDRGFMVNELLKMLASFSGETN